MVMSKRRKAPLILISLGFFVAVVGGVSWYFLSPPAVKPLEVSGRLEGYETDIGTKVAGRIESIAVREGDAVHKGQIIVRLDDAEIQAQLRGAKAHLTATQQEELQARLQINVLDSQIQEIQLNWQQAKEDAQGRVFQSEASVASSVAQLNQAQAQLQQAQAELNLAKLNRDRYSQLITEGAISKQQFDQAQTAYETALANVKARKASVESFRKLVNAAQGQLLQAKTSQFNPDIRNRQIQQLKTQLSQARLKLAAAQAEIAKATAEQQEIQSKIADLTIKSPIDGVVTSRSVEPGVVVTTGKTLLSVINPDDIYLRGFIPEGKIGLVRIGQKAKIFLDSDPDKPWSGRVIAIDTQASFTPENIYFQEDRVQQVFGIKISLDNPSGLAKPGMPADAELITQ
jgi:HlyD family secretion protein